MCNNLVVLNGSSDDELSASTSACSFTLFLQNIRSLRKNYDILVCNIESLVNLPKLIVLTET